MSALKLKLAMNKTILTQTLLIILLIAICITNVYSQKGKKVSTTNASNNVLINSKLDSLYADYDNDIEIKIPTPYNIYGITVSQGSIRNNDDSAKNISGLNILSDLKTGTVTITIYKNNQVFKQRTFGVREKIFPQYARRITEHIPVKPVITFGGHENREIDASELGKINKLEINSPYKILKYEVVMTGDKVFEKKMYSPFFNWEIIVRFTRGYKDHIIFQGIFFEDNEGNIYYYEDIVFNVTYKKLNNSINNNH